MTNAIRAGPAGRTAKRKAWTYVTSVTAIFAASPRESWMARKGRFYELCEVSRTLVKRGKREEDARKRRGRPRAQKRPAAAHPRARTPNVMTALDKGAAFYGIGTLHFVF